MVAQKLLYFLLYGFIFSILSGQQVVQGHHHHSRHRLFGSRPTKLFVFGDSYVDTGNMKPEIFSWKYPYGMTFPGKPTGRFSDGRVLTDYVANFIGLESPITYNSWKLGEKDLKSGMNFAYGGTGVFDTLVPGPNMTMQVDFFQNLIKDNVFTAADLESSVALVSFTGNDDWTYLVRNGSIQGWQSFITAEVDQLTVNLKRIHGLGVRKIAVTASEPLGCLPPGTAKSSFQQCNGTENLLVSSHISVLRQAVAKLNNETKNNDFVILDLYATFMSVVTDKGSTKFKNPLKPCCIPVSSEYSCGSVDETGAKKYTVCEDPESSFFWDMAHPTQEGWRVVSSAFQATLQQL